MIKGTAGTIRRFVTGDIRDTLPKYKRVTGEVKTITERLIIILLKTVFGKGRFKSPHFDSARLMTGTAIQIIERVHKKESIKLMSKTA